MEMWPTTIEAVWPLVREKALPELQRSPGGAMALMEQCREGRATVWRGKEAVFVLSLAPNADGGLDLFVRMAVSLSPDADVIGTHLGFLQRVAFDLGADAIRFRTLRRGFERALGSQWTLAHCEYMTQVPRAR